MEDQTGAGVLAAKRTCLESLLLELRAVTCAKNDRTWSSAVSVSGEEIREESEFAAVDPCTVCFSEASRIYLASSISLKVSICEIAAPERRGSKRQKKPIQPERTEC